MTSNFHFLSPQWPTLAESAAKVEAFAHADPRTACFWARRTLELTLSSEAWSILSLASRAR
jgi:type I restriction enzyme, R subunit